MRETQITSIRHRHGLVLKRCRAFVNGLAIALCFDTPLAYSQQPFATDDAEVTKKGQFHFEFSNEFDVLQRSSFPNLKQNAAYFRLKYGLLKHVEVGVECPPQVRGSACSSASR